MTKNIFFLIFIFLFFSIYEIKGEIIIEALNMPENASNTGEFIRINERSLDFILNLPYEVGEDIKYVFDGFTPYALDIIEIRADGEKLPFVFYAGIGDTIRDYDIRETIKGKKEYFITMYWYLDDTGEQILRWDDSRGFRAKQIEPGLFLAYTHCYEISMGMKVLDITYRVVLPYPSLTIDNLSDVKYENKIYTEVYTITIDISNLFPITH